LLPESSAVRETKWGASESGAKVWENKTCWKEVCSAYAERKMIEPSY